MTVSLKHTTQAVGTDAGNGEIRKDQWNEEHALTQATNRLLGRTTAGDGATEEISVGAGLTLASGSLVNDVIGKQTIWVPALAMVPRTTNGAGSGTAETSSNRVMIRTLDFDGSTQEFAQFAIQMPKSWDEGTIIAQFLWSHPATTVNFGVVWGISAQARSDNENLDNAFGTVVTVTDTGGTTDRMYITSETGAVTVGSTPSPEDYITFQIQRNPADASDTMAVDARLHGVKIHYTIDAARDN